MNVHVKTANPVNHRLAERLRAELEGEVLFDAASRARYATDASFYQIEPLGVVVPKRADDVAAALSLAREEGVSVLVRGGGTSQSGQTVGRSLVIDFTKHLNSIVESDFEAGEVVVQPGIVMDELNRQIKGSGLWFPVDVSTSSRATIGGMTGNNSCGTRSIRYGIMRDNVRAIDAWLADGKEAHFGELPADFAALDMPDAVRELMRDLRQLGEREATHIAQAFPDVSRRVGGYLLDAILPGTGDQPINAATLLCGSEGTLAISKQIRLKLSRQPVHKALGLCHFATFRGAMEAAQHIVKLGPVAVELVDKTLIELARDIAMFRPIMEAYVRGKPDALLLVEFAEDDQSENLRRLDQLEELMGDLGGEIVKVEDGAQQKAIWGVRAAGLNIMMSMKSEGKPVSFIEDCAVPLENLADYTERLTAVFEKHGTTGTWYAHASVGCLHVRPVLNLKLEADTRKMRAIAEEAFAMVREYKGSHSGEHGDGLVRSEFHEVMYGRRTVELFEEIKNRFDPGGMLNPGKIVRPSKMDDRSLFRFKPGYGVREFETGLDWSAYPGAGDGFQGAVEMCNNNGECRKLAGGVMCPSYRVTRDERDVTRGRANTLRLAISGQLGRDALTSDQMLETLKLCVSCKACRRECPTGVDMARMKAEVLHARHKRFGAPLRDRLVGYLPRFAPLISKLAALANLPGSVGVLAWVQERGLGFTARRALPRWAGEAWREPAGHERRSADGTKGEVVLFADTFNRYFEPDNIRAAEKVLTALGYHVTYITPRDGGRPACCGRTFLSAGFIDEARVEAQRFLEGVLPAVRRGAAVVGLEPSCLLSMRDEFAALLPGEDTAQLGEQALLFEEFLAREAKAGRIAAPIAALDGDILVHGHCHQKSFGAAGSVTEALGLLDGARASMVETSCCGMAGSFGYQAETYETSMAMAELDLLPAVRKAPAATRIAADGFSCRHQIRHGAAREAVHVARIIADAMGL